MQAQERVDILGVFSGVFQGPVLILGKAMGQYLQNKGERVVPIIDSVLTERFWLSMIQDDASPHTTSQTTRE